MTLNYRVSIAPTWSKYYRNPLVVEILESVSGFEQTKAIIGGADQIITELAQEQAIVSDGVEAVLNSGEIPPDWLASMATERMKQEVTAYKRETVSQLLDAAGYRLESIALSATDTILTGLNTRMQSVVTELADAVQRLNGASTPLQAIEVGGADAWKAVTELRTRYNQIRTAQTLVMVTSASDILQQAKSPYADNYQASDSVIKNLDEVWPVCFTESARHHDIPWAYEADEFLVWCIRSGAELWVPTVPELESLRAERKRSTNEAANELAISHQNDQRWLREQISAGQIHPLVQQELHNRGLV